MLGNLNPSPLLLTGQQIEGSCCILTETSVSITHAGWAYPEVKDFQSFGAESAYRNDSLTTRSMVLPD
jgi:hypothetical protein